MVKMICDLCSKDVKNRVYLSLMGEDVCDKSPPKLNISMTLNIGMHSCAPWVGGDYCLRCLIEFLTRIADRLDQK